MAKIAAMPNSVERLADYDALASKLGVAPNSRQSETAAGKWTIRTTISPIDDAKIVSASLDSDSPISARIGKSTPTLILRFKEGKVEVYINFGIFLGSENITSTIRFGKEEAQTQKFSVSTNYESAFWQGEVQTFLTHLSKVDTFVIRVTPYGESSVTVSFTLAGIDKVLEAIYAASVAKK